jgi:hypothetical protein
MYICQRCGEEVAVTFFDQRLSDQEVCELCYEALQGELDTPRAVKTREGVMDVSSPD